MATENETIPPWGVRVWIAIVAIALGSAFVLTISGISFAASPAGVTPREVTEQGEQSSYEKSTISLYENSGDSVGR